SHSASDRRYPPAFPTRRSSDLALDAGQRQLHGAEAAAVTTHAVAMALARTVFVQADTGQWRMRKHHAGNIVVVQMRILAAAEQRSEEHTSELQSRFELVCRLLL